MLENIKKQLESAYEIRDINDIEKDIEEGKNLLKNFRLKEKQFLRVRNSTKCRRLKLNRFFLNLKCHFYLRLYIWLSLLSFCLIVFSDLCIYFFITRSFNY